jgi:circadian clock protein KaiC
MENQVVMDDAAPIDSGVPGLNHLMRGGFAKGRAHLVEGRPGSGKTTVGLQFLLDGVRRGETCLYITLSESRRELISVAHRHGWSLDGLAIYELVPPELSLDKSKYQSMLHSSELELGETLEMALAAIEKHKPTRLVFDSLSEIRILSQGSLRYRRQVLALKSFVLLNDITTLFLDDLTGEQDDLNLHSVCHGVLRLEHYVPAYGAERRRARLIKMRGVQIRGGFHDMVIRPGGVTIFPRLTAADHAQVDFGADAESGTGLDDLFNGGLPRGTSTLLMGPSGTGKSSISARYAYAALKRGEPVYLVTFEETRRIILTRARGTGMDLAPFLESGLLTLDQVDPAELSPGEITGRLQQAVEASGVKMVIIDSLTGYLNSLPEEQQLLLQMHEILTYLNQQGIVTLLLLANHGLIGHMNTAVDLTYLSDSVMLLRYFEAEGRIRRAVSVVKKRTGPHEDAIREFTLSSDGLSVGEPLSQFSGVLSGIPRFEGERASLMRKSQPESQPKS